MTKPFFSCLIVFLALTAMSGTTFAQKETATGYQIEQDLSLLRRDLRNDKKQLIATNVPFTADEATKFWPVYDEYVLAMSKNYDEFYALIKDYGEHEKTITDTQASSMLKRWADIQVKLAETRRSYVPKFEKTAPGRKIALFMQIDRRLYELMDLQIAFAVPLVSQQNP